MLSPEVSEASVRHLHQLLITGKYKKIWRNNYFTGFRLNFVSAALESRLSVWFFKKFKTVLKDQRSSLYRYVERRLLKLKCGSWSGS